METSSLPTLSFLTSFKSANSSWKDKAISIESLPRWNSLANQEEGNGKKKPSDLKFEVDEKLNNKVALWLGDIRLLKVDAIVNSTNDSMNDIYGLSGAILTAAGDSLREEIYSIEPCKTGECRVTGGYDLPATYIIHTVTPKFNERYKTAAENALHSCYKSSLELLIEKEGKTIAFPIIENHKKSYPRENGSHIAVRTLRRFLEHYHSELELVIFCVDTEVDLSFYKTIFQLYFPRNIHEEIISKQELPRDVGNEFGETVVEERKIRISAFPSPNSYEGPVGSGIPKTVSYESSNPFGNIGSFAMMQNDPDEEKKKKFKYLIEDKAKLEQQQLYLNWLLIAQSIDLSDVENLKIILESGTDHLNRTIVVIIGNRLPTKSKIMLERTFLYMIRLLDQITDKAYVVVYYHTLMEEKNTPDFAWMKKVYNIMDAKYGNHLGAFYVVHPTFWLKIFEGIVSTFISNDSFFAKLKYIDSLKEMFNSIDPDQLYIPEEVLEYDKKINGTLAFNNKKPRNADDL